MDFNGKVYFYIARPDKTTGSCYQHVAVCLAEGLHKLGLQFYANTDYWKMPDENRYLFQHNPSIRPDDCEIVVTNSELLYAEKRLPESLFHSNRKYITVYLDQEDGVTTRSWNREFRKFDHIFKLHFNRFYKMPPNMHPWVFGLTERIIRATGNGILYPFSERRRAMLCNFRANHPVREEMANKLLPRIQHIFSIDNTTEDFQLNISQADYLLWHQTGCRHYQSYYDRLKRSAACNCVGGIFIPAWPGEYIRNNHFLNITICPWLSKIRKRILQWDSFRLWESFAAGCVTFHCDLVKYGALLPVMPEPWKHYIGIDFDNIEAMICRIDDIYSLMANISSEGRRWALDNYAPLPTAIRFLSIVLR